MKITKLSTQVSKMTVIIIERDIKNNYVPPYFGQFLTFYDTWLMHKYIGCVNKNFRY